LDFKVRYGCEKQKRLILVEITIGMAAANYLRPKKAEREFVNFKKPTNATLALGKSGVCRMYTECVAIANIWCNYLHTSQREQHL